MASMRSRMAGLAGAAAIAASVLLAAPSGALAKPGGYPSVTCTGGPIAGGSYSSIKVTGDCSMDNEFVFVYGNIDVKANAMLWTTTDMFLWVKGNINVGHNAVLSLGCTDISCIVAPVPVSRPGAPLGQPSGFWGYVGGNIDADDAMAVIVVGVNVVKNVSQHGGGGGGCGVTAPVTIKDGNSSGGIAFYIYNSIGGSLSIEHLNTCAIFVFENLVNNNVNDNNNTTWCNIASHSSSCIFSPTLVNPAPTTPSTGNLIVQNGIGGNLNCRRNVPPAFQEDNFIGGHATGECVWVPAP